MGTTTTGTSSAVETCESSSNPLLDQKGLPKFSTIEPNNILPAVEFLIQKMDNEFSSLEENLSTTSTADKNKKNFDDTLEEVERIQSSLGYAWGVTGHLNA